jgi:hypothetical protein
MILERLRRVLAGMGSSRNAGVFTYPAQVFYGPMACLINHYEVFRMLQSKGLLSDERLRLLHS